MITTLNIVLLGLLLWIFLEDLKERQISLIVVLSLIILGGSLNYRHHILELFLISTLINALVIAVVVFILWIYSKFKLKKDLFQVFGLGDFLFFVFLVVAFPTPTFLVVFSSSLIFAFLISILFQKKLTKWVPLAGLQALFVALVVGVNEIGEIINLYAL